MSIINNTLMACDISFQEVDLVITSLMTIFTLIIVLYNLKYLKFIFDTNPTYIRAKELHSDNIKNIVEDLKNRIENYHLSIKLIRNRPTNYNSGIEKNHPNFFDDLEEHEPTDLKISQDWNKYKQKIDDFNSSQFELFNKIVDKINSETGLDYAINVKADGDVFTYDYIVKIFSSISDKHSTGDEIKPIHFDVIKQTHGLEPVYTYENFAKGNDRDKLESIRQIGLNLPKLVEDEGWLEDFNKFHELMDEFEEIKSELLRKIGEFLLIPLYPEDCSIIKGIKKNL